jgi:hypothetical protein
VTVSPTHADDRVVAAQVELGEHVVDPTEYLQFLGGLTVGQFVHSRAQPCDALDDFSGNTGGSARLGEYRHCFPVGASRQKPFVATENDLGGVGDRDGFH